MLTKSLIKSIRDKALLVICALFAAALGFFSFAFADKYHITRGWIFGLWIGVVFVAAIGTSLRARFRRPEFIVFFVGWLFAHILLMLLVMSHLNLLLWIPAIFVELWVGYALAFRLFGLPPREGS